MKAVVISDVTFEPVLKQLGQYPDLKVEKYIYADQIVSGLINIHRHLLEIDILIIYFDCYFFRYTDAYIVEILNAIKNIASSFTGNILVSNNLANGRHNSILKNNIGQHEQVIIEQEAAIKGILQTSNAYFYDIKKIISQLGLQNIYNYKLGFLYQMPYKKEFINALSSELVSITRFFGTPEKKAIFLDCDNTLWKGILGEDGLDGIQCDRNDKGVLFFQFQEFLLEKKNEGFILGLCSKNNPYDVKEAFSKLNMPLKWDDFLIKKVNWENKSGNLKEAAHELNIGLDSFIFIDDSDFEIQSVLSMTPDVHTLKLPEDYDTFLPFIDNYIFKRKRLTAEDLGKKEQFLAEQKRNEVKTSVQSFEEYVESLSIKPEITLNNFSDFSRLSQLTEKTNQFNFNKEVYNTSGLEKFIADGNIIYGLRVSDRFGDYGLVGLMLIEIRDKKATVRNFLLSCRALGRMIEDTFFNFVVHDLNEKGVELYEIIFKETSKNAPAKTFYNKLIKPNKKHIQI